MKKIYIFLFFSFLSLAFVFKNNNNNHQENTNPIYDWEAALKNPASVSHLNLSFAEWDTIPKEIGLFTQLTHLDLSNFQWSTLPNGITNLKQLQHLKLKGVKNINTLSVFENISQINTLESIDFSGSWLVFIPRSIEQFDSLKSLNLSQTKLQRLPKGIQYLKQLKQLDLSNNDLRRLPFELSYLPIQKLDLSNNDWKVKTTFEVLQSMEELTILKWHGLHKLPKRMSKLTALEEVDFSYGSYQNLPTEIHNLKQLSRLSLNHCERLNLSKNLVKLQQNRALKHLEIQQNQLKKTPASLNKLSQLETLIIGGNILEKIDAISNLQNLKALSVSHSPKLNIAHLITKTKVLVELEHLQLQNCNINKLPQDISQLSQLVSLDLSQNNLTELPESIASLQNLRNLRLNGNFLSKETIFQLKEWLPNCQIDFVLPPSPLQRNIQPPLPTVTIPTEKYTVIAERAVLLTTPTGTTIDIPKNAFLDKNGTVVTGQVDIEYREFNNPLDIYLSGIPMAIEDNGKIEQFRSAGMIEFNASQNGEELQANPSSVIDIEINSTQDDRNFNLYSFDEEIGEWREDTLQEEVVTAFTPNLTPSIATFESPPRVPSLPKVHTQAVFLKNINPRYDNYSKRKRQKSLDSTSVLTFNTIVGGISATVNDTFYQSPEMKYSWAYEGPDKEAIYQLLKWIEESGRKERVFTDEALENWEENWEEKMGFSYTESFHRIITDFKIVPNYEYDTYNLLFISAADTIVIPAMIVSEEVKGKEEMIYSQIVFFKKYTAGNNKRKEALDKVAPYRTNILQLYEDDLSNYQQKRTAYEYNRLIIEQALTTVKTRRGVSLNEFGLKNIDQYLRLPQNELAIEIKDQNGQIVALRNSIVLDETVNMPITFQGNKISYVIESQQSLLLINDKEEIATVSHYVFQTTDKTDGILRLQVDWKPIKEVNRQKLSLQIANL